MDKDARQKGFTLLELMVTISVAAIILSFGVPGFISFIQNNRAVTHTNDLVTALNLARSEATRRGTRIRVCSSTDGATCGASNDWSTGWIVQTQGGELLRSWPERSGGAGVVSGDGSEVAFLARGSVQAGAVLQVRLPDCSGDQERVVTVNGAGRVSVARENCS